MKFDPMEWALAFAMTGIGVFALAAAYHIINCNHSGIL